MISRERILELREFCDAQELTQAEMIELRSVCDLALKTPQWIAWKKGDPMPPAAPNEWLVTTENADGYRCLQTCIRTHADYWVTYPKTIAYWSEPLPAPYVTE